MGGRVVWLYGSEGLHEMKVLRGREGEVVWSYGSEGLHEMRVMRGWEGEGCLVVCVKGDYMRGGGLSTPSGVVGLRINVKMTFTRN